MTVYVWVWMRVRESQCATVCLWGGRVCIHVHVCVRSMRQRLLRGCHLNFKSLESVLEHTLPCIPCKQAQTQAQEGAAEDSRDVMRRRRKS